MAINDGILYESDMEKRLDSYKNKIIVKTKNNSNVSFEYEGKLQQLIFEDNLVTGQAVITKTRVTSRKERLWYEYTGSGDADCFIIKDGELITNNTKRGYRIEIRNKVRESQNIFLTDLFMNELFSPIEEKILGIYNLIRKSKNKTLNP